MAHNTDSHIISQLIWGEKIAIVRYKGKQITFSLLYPMSFVFFLLDTTPMSRTSLLDEKKRRIVWQFDLLLAHNCHFTKS